MQKIKELTIKEEQSIQLRIMKLFADICKREDLQYFLAYGTLLGAIREHGFIEWDDDIDIWMPRKDINKLCEVFGKYALEDMFLQTYITDPMSVSPEMVRICLDGTYKWPKGCENEKFHTGIYFDIFPLDFGFGTDRDLVDLELSTKLHKKIWQSLHESSHSKSIKSRLYTVYRHLIPRMKYNRKYVELINSHSKCESDVIVVFASSFAGYCRSLFSKTYFDEQVFIPFEDLFLPAPKNAESLLAYMYGEDYMTPTKTKPHRIIAYLTK